MTRNRLLDFAVTAMCLALIVMLASVAWPTPRTLAAFFAVGLTLGAGALVLFFAAILRDLRHRRVL